MRESEDQHAIRALVAEWMDATRRGDIETVLSLMTDDVVFLLPGQEPMGRAAFRAASGAQSAARPRFDAVSDIKEIHVDGTTAYLWSHLAVTITPPSGDTPIERAGHTLTIFRKVDGRWRLARDANLLTKIG